MALIPKRDGPGTQLLESPFGVYPFLRAEEIASTSDCVRGAPTLDAPALAPDIFDNKCFQKENTHTNLTDMARVVATNSTKNTKTVATVGTH